MPDNIEIPAWVWVVGVKIVLVALIVIGLIVVVVFWKTGRLPFSGLRIRAAKGKEHDATGHARRNDDLIERLIEQNEAQMTRFLEAYRENTGVIQGVLNALRAVAGEAEICNREGRAGRVFIESAFTRVHERLDVINGRLK